MTTRSLPNVETIFRAGAPMIMITGGGLKVLTADDARTLAAMLTEAANRVEHHENYGDPMTLGNIYPSDVEKAAAAPTATAQNSASTMQKGSIKR